MEGSVEKGDLGHVGRDSADGADSGELVRLVQRCERYQFLECGEHLVIDEHRRRIIQSAVDHAVADGGESGSLPHAGEPFMNDAMAPA